MARLVGEIIALPRYSKRVLFISADFAMCGGTLWLLLSFRYACLYVPADTPTWLLLTLAPVLTVVFLAQFGVYRMVTRFIGYQGAKRMAQAALLAGIVWSVVILLAGQHGIPRSISIGYGLITGLLTIASRQAAGHLLHRLSISVANTKKVRKKIAIYGAGPTCGHLIDQFERNNDRKVVVVIDPTPNIQRQFIHGVKVQPPEKLEHIVAENGLDEVIVVFAEHQRAERRDALAKLIALPVRALVLRDIEEITSDSTQFQKLRPAKIEDLIGRQRVTPMQELMAKAVTGKSILVTGAGGSIGSELVRQIIGQNARRLVVMDVSEPALYEIQTRVNDILRASPHGSRPPKTDVIYVLGSVLDKALVANALESYGVDTVYHAAAYKHVSMVEQNPLSALANNVLGTENMARAAQACGVEHFVLVSSDKAVRPTSVMGASKRLAELTIQALERSGAAEGRPNTTFVTVRFGNVLDSSGSVVRKFRRQIEAGGPVTVTHPEVTRFFMAVEEAAELVVQAGALAEGGDVFVLDMGEPIKINDLAKMMIRQAGQNVRTSAHPDDGIEIVYIGLYPGEKIYEELLIEGKSTPTVHPRIYRDDEAQQPPLNLDHELRLLEDAIHDLDSAAVFDILKRVVPEYGQNEATLRDEFPNHLPLGGSHGQMAG